MKRMTAEAPKHRIDLVRDDQVVIADGSLQGFGGQGGRDRRGPRESESHGLDVRTRDAGRIGLLADKETLA